MRGFAQWRWHLDEVFVKISGKLRYLWRAVDQEGAVLDSVVTVNRDKAAALKLLKRIIKKYGRPRSVVIDGLCSYSAAMKKIGSADRHEPGRSLNNRAENPHQPFRRQERAVQRFRSIETQKKFVSIHAEVHNHFNHEHHLLNHEIYKRRRSVAMEEWRVLLRHPSCAGCSRRQCSAMSRPVQNHTLSCLRACSRNLIKPAALAGRPINRS